MKLLFSFIFFITLYKLMYSQEIEIDTSMVTRQFVTQYMYVDSLNKKFNFIKEKVGHTIDTNYSKTIKDWELKNNIVINNMLIDSLAIDYYSFSAFLSLGTNSENDIQLNNNKEIARESLVEFLDQYKKGGKKIFSLESIWAQKIGIDKLSSALVYYNAKRPTGLHYAGQNQIIEFTKEYYDEFFSNNVSSSYCTILIKTNVPIFAVNANGIPFGYTYKDELAIQIPLNETQNLSITKDGYKEFKFPAFKYTSIKFPPKIYKATLEKN